MSDFATAVNQWCIKAMGLTEDVFRRAAYKLCLRIIMDTPVDGSVRRDDVVARGDWNSAVGHEPGDVERNDWTGVRALEGVRAVLAAWQPRTGEPFVFANYKDYIERIEYLGWDGHEPYGMVGRHVIEWDDIVKEAARELSGSA
jgi:hypothetical protein